MRLDHSQRHNRKTGEERKEREEKTGGRTCREGALRLTLVIFFEILVSSRRKKSVGTTTKGAHREQKRPSLRDLGLDIVNSQPLERLLRDRLRKKKRTGKRTRPCRGEVTEYVHASKGGKKKNESPSIGERSGI